MLAVALALWPSSVLAVTDAMPPNGCVYTWVVRLPAVVASVIPSPSKSQSYKAISPRS